MARRVFFSFHYERDVWRSAQVRKSWVTRGGQSEGRFYDGSLWEEAKKKGDAAIARMIDNGLKNTSVTAVLIGKETAERKWVNYEIEKSIERGNALLGIYIQQLKDQHGDSNYFRGENPFANFELKSSGRNLARYIPTYDWVDDDGYNNLPAWIESARRVQDIPAETTWII